MARQWIGLGESHSPDGRKEDKEPIVVHIGGNGSEIA